MKVTVEFNNGATVTYHGTEAEDIANYLSLSEDDYPSGEAVDIGLANPPFLSKEADDPDEPQPTIGAHDESKCTDGRRIVNRSGDR